MKTKIVSLMLAVIMLLSFVSCGGEVPDVVGEPTTSALTPTEDESEEPIKEPPREIAGNIVFYCDVPEYEKIKDTEMLESAVSHMQEKPSGNLAHVSVWLCENKEQKSNTKEYYASLYENAADVLTELMYTDIHPNEYAPFVSMAVPYSALSAQTLEKVAENELIAMLIVSHPFEIVDA